MGNGFHPFLSVVCLFFPFTEHYFMIWLCSSQSHCHKHTKTWRNACRANTQHEHEMGKGNNTFTRKGDMLLGLLDAHPLKSRIFLLPSPRTPTNNPLGDKWFRSTLEAWEKTIKRKTIGVRCHQLMKKESVIQTLTKNVSIGKYRQTITIRPWKNHPNLEKNNPKLEKNIRALKKIDPGTDNGFSA